MKVEIKPPKWIMFSEIQIGRCFRYKNNYEDEWHTYIKTNWECIATRLEDGKMVRFGCGDEVLPLFNAKVVEGDL